MTVTLIEGVAVFLMYLFGGALVLFIYEAYLKTRQKNMIYLAVGFFILIFGGNFITLDAIATTVPGLPSLDESVARLLSLVIQLIGILLLLYSVIGPYEPRHPKE